MYQVQQENRPLLSPSIDDFLSESRGDAPSTLTSNTAGLSTALDLVDLSDLAAGGSDGPEEDQKVPLRRKASSRSPRRRARPDETELIQVEVEHLPASPRTPERVSLDSGGRSSPLDKWDAVNLDVEDGGHRRRPEERSTSRELLWSAELKTKNSFDVHELDPPSPPQDVAASRRTRSLFGRNESLEDEFVRAKAAVESDTEFWDKMQAEWEELARRNWLEDSEGPGSPPPSDSPVEMAYSFSPNNPYLDWPSAFAEGQERAGGGDLRAGVLLLEAAVLQDPQDSEAWQLLGTTQAENENEPAATAALQRCLELRPHNLPALMALAVSFTNSGLQREASGALRHWISHNPRYKDLVLDPRSPPRGNRTPTASAELQDVLVLFQDAVFLNLDSVDPDLQTGLGVLFNLSCDFNRAVEAFSAALSVRPQDYLLWNRLGATLANGARSEEAVEAYTRALALQPGFIRSRYNLGISCLHLGAHREAVSNFLAALNQQRSCSRQQMSEVIWTGLRTAVSTMDRAELLEAAEAGDLDLLTRAFHGGHA